MSGFLTNSQIARFKRTVAAYKPSETVVDKFVKSDFAVIAGPSASGKDTLREGLLKLRPDIYVKILSTTTRPKRRSEAKNKAYQFISVQSMEELIEEKKVLQAALVHNQQVSATQASEIDKLSPGKIGLSILVIQAEEELYKINQNIKTIFLIPPSLDEMIHRLKHARVTSKPEIDRRLSTAKREIKMALDIKRYQCIVSDELNSVEKTADEFLGSGQLVKTQDIRARETMRSILEHL